MAAETGSKSSTGNGVESSRTARIVFLLPLLPLSPHVSIRLYPGSGKASRICAGCGSS